MYDVGWYIVLFCYVILFISNPSQITFTDKPWKNDNLCKLTLDKEILQWHAIYRMHNHQLEWNALVFVLHTLHTDIADSEIDSVTQLLNTADIQMP